MYMYRHVYADMETFTVRGTTGVEKREDYVDGKIKRKSQRG